MKLRREQNQYLSKYSARYRLDVCDIYVALTIAQLSYTLFSLLNNVLESALPPDFWH